MRLFIISLIIAAFLQSAFLPLNLVLCLIIARSFVAEYKSNLYASFLAGLLLGLLTASNIGFWGIVFLTVSKLVHVLRNLPYFNSGKLFLLFAFLIITSVSFISQFFTNDQFNWIKIVVETFICLPLYFFIRIWEERFVVREDVRLKIRK